MENNLDKVTTEYKIEFRDKKTIVYEGFKFRAIYLWLVAAATGALGGAIVVTVILIASHPTGFDVYYIYIALLFTIGLLLYLSPAIVNFYLKRKWDKDDYSPRTYSWDISKENISVISDIDDSQIDWVDITEVTETRNLFKFKFGTEPIFLPKRILATNQVLRIRNIVEQKIDSENNKVWPY